MFISVQKSGKDNRNAYVKLVESYRDENKRTKQRIIKNFGRLDDLLAKDPQALDKLKAQYKNEAVAKKKATAAERLAQVQKVINIPDTESALANVPFPSLFYGHYALKRLWEDVLCLDRKLKYIGKCSNSRFDFNAAVSFMAFHKVMDPASVLHTFETRDTLLGDPAKDLSLDDLYNTLDVLKEHKDDIVNWVNTHIDKAYGKSRSKLIFYDVTNAYFETAMTDAERGYEQKDFAENLLELALQARAEGTLGQECFDSEGELIVQALPESFLSDVADKRIKYLRMRGPSKEHRYDLPLVSIALVVDKYGMPIDFEVFAGNQSEFTAMPGAISKLKQKYNVDEAIVVADRGLNSSDNLKMLLDKNLGFLMAQKISRLDKETHEKMLELESYKPIDREHPEAGYYRVIKGWKEIETETQGKVKETLILTYNEKRKARDLAILDVWCEIVKEKMAAGEKIGPKRSGWAALAEISDKKEREILGIDQAVYEKKKALCGFAAMVCSPALTKTEELDDEGITNPEMNVADIAGIYHQLNQIEDCFRVMKSNLGLRPMFVRNSNHVRGHITVCVLALILIRLLQRKLREAHHPMSVNEVCETVGRATVTAVKLDEKKTCYMLTQSEFNVRKNRKNIKTRELIEMIERGEIVLDHMPEVMKAVRLSPVPRICSRAELARALATRFASDEDAIPELRFRCL